MALCAPGSVGLTSYRMLALRAFENAPDPKTEAKLFAAYGHRWALLLQTGGRLLERCPMESIGAFNAKTRFSEPLARAERGESFVITKHGRPMARLTPESGPDREKARAAAKRLKALRGSIKGVTLEELCEDIHAGHRF